MFTDHQITQELQCIENIARIETISDEYLRTRLYHFLAQAGYVRTPYKMQFKGFQRARAGTFADVEAACMEFGHTDKLRYPPIKDCKSKLARCNLAGVSVFYCANDSAIPLFEIRPEVDQYVVLSKYGPSKPGKIELSLPIIGVKQIRETYLKRDPEDEMIAMLDQDMHFKSSNQTALQIDNRIASWFVEPFKGNNPYVYRLTTAYYDVLKQYVTLKDKQINALLYPSVESEITGYNLVLEPSVVDEKLKLEYAVIYRVENAADKNYSLRPLKISSHIDDDGNLYWTDSDASHLTFDFNPDTPTINAEDTETLKAIWHSRNSHPKEVAP